MRSHTALYVHLVWTTWRRMPLITPDLRPELYRVLAHRCESHEADVIAVGGTADHVHLFVRMRPTISVAELAQHAKGASSHFVTQVLASPKPFRWQAGYGAFTVSPRHVDTVRAYVLNQEAHHRDGTTVGAMERTWDFTPRRRSAWRPPPSAR